MQWTPVRLAFAVIGGLILLAWHQAGRRDADVRTACGGVPGYELPGSLLEREGWHKARRLCASAVP